MKHFVATHAKMPAGEIQKWYWVGSENSLATTNILKATSFDDPAQAKKIVDEEMFLKMIGKLIIRMAPHVVSMTDEEYFLLTLKK